MRWTTAECRESSPPAGREGCFQRPAGIGPTPHTGDRAPDPGVAPTVKVTATSSTVRVTRSPATADGPSPATPGGLFGSDNVDALDGSMPQVLVEATNHRGRQQPQLGGPGSGVGSHGDVTVLKALRSAMRRHVGTHNETPAAEDAVDSDIGAPAAVDDELVDGGAQECRVSSVGMGAGHLG